METKKKKVHKYTAFFEASEDGGYTVTIPALPGLVTEGKDLEHAQTNTNDAARYYIESRKKAKESVPVERELAQVKISIVS
jgi:antitoxin HicB